MMNFSKSVHASLKSWKQISLSFGAVGLAAGSLWLAQAAPDKVEKSSLLSVFEPARMNEVIKKQVAKQVLKTDVKLLDLSVFEGVTTALHYKYRAEPSYRDGYFTRYDQYTIDANVNPATWIDQLQGPVGFGLSAGSQLTFARQFKSQKESIIASPYLPERIPLSAERARSKLEAGDFVSFETHTGVVVSAGLSLPAAGAIAQSASTHVYLEGRFLVHLYKVDADHIRLKLIARRSHGEGAGYSAGLSRSEFRAIGFRLVDRAIHRWVELDPAQLSASHDVTDLFLSDFVFDLRRPEAAQAFEDLMTRKVRFKSLALTNPLVSRSDLGQLLITDLTEVERLAAEDAGRREEDRRVSRIFKGSNTSNTQSGRFNIGLNLFRLEKNGYFSQNRILSFDTQDRPQKYRFDHYSRQSATKYIFRLFDTSESINTGVLFLADDDYEPKTFNALVMSREIKSSSLTKDQFTHIRDQVARVLPPSLFARIPQKDWDYEFTERVNVFFKHQITFTSKALEAIPPLSMLELYQRLQQYLRSIPAPEAPATTTYPGNSEVTPKSTSSITERYDEDLQTIAAALMRALDPGRTPSERYGSFAELRDNALFREIGAGFLLRLLPEDQLESLIHYEYHLSAKAAESVDMEFGRHNEDRLYNSLLYIQSVLNNRSIDLRLLQEK